MGPPETPATPLGTPDPIDVFDGVASVLLGDVLLSLWRTPAKVHRIERVMTVMERLLGRTPDSIVACQFLLSTAAPPGFAEGRAIQRGLGVVLPRARRLITVPVGDAAWHTVVRSIMRAGVALTGHGRLIKVGASPDEAFRLITEVSAPVSPDLAGLLTAFDALHLALDLAPPGGARAR